jgi:UDP-N-acetylmuramoylalanine--D-glutamate ligase
MTIETLALQGNSTIYGSMAAGIGTRIHEIRNDFIKNCFTDFQGIEHRMEHVANVHGIEFINDSKATNINSTWFALESINQPIIWIAGGIDKGNDYAMLLPLVLKKVKAIICLGKDNRRLLSCFGGLNIPLTETISMEEAIDLAYIAGKIGDVVLLSPASPSFDLYKDYEDRGYNFKKAVRSL